MDTITKRSFVGVLALALAVAAAPASAQAAKQRPQFVYVLRVAPPYHDSATWTDKENAAVGRHFARLKQAAEAGQLVLAGKTSEALDKTFGLVIFEADDEAAARRFMNDDPAVVAGVMTATLHPYAIALQRKP